MQTPRQSPPDVGTPDAPEPAQHQIPTAAPLSVERWSPLEFSDEAKVPWQLAVETDPPAWLDDSAAQLPQRIKRSQSLGDASDEALPDRRPPQEVEEEASGEWMPRAGLLRAAGDELPHGLRERLEAIIVRGPPPSAPSIAQLHAQLCTAATLRRARGKTAYQVFHMLRLAQLKRELPRLKHQTRFARAGYDWRALSADEQRVFADCVLVMSECEENPLNESE